MLRSALALGFALLTCARTAFAEVEKPAKAPSQALPPRAPDPDEQRPRPYLAGPSAESPERVEIGPDLALAYRPSDGPGADYSAGFAWGAHARAELCRWLGFRIYFLNSTHAVSVADNELLDGTKAEQPDLRVLQLGARIEPTWPITRQFRVWAGLGLAWDRIWADQPVFSERAVEMPDRTGVALEYSAALGARFDVIPRWFAVSLAFSAATVASQTGKMFGRQSGLVDEANGNLVSVAGLPQFSGSYSAVLGLGLLL